MFGAWKTKWRHRTATKIWSWWFLYQEQKTSRLSSQKRGWTISPVPNMKHVFCCWFLGALESFGLCSKRLCFCLLQIFTMEIDDEMHCKYACLNQHHLQHQTLTPNLWTVSSHVWIHSLLLQRAVTSSHWTAWDKLLSQRHMLSKSQWYVAVPLNPWNISPLDSLSASALVAFQPIL